MNLNFKLIQLALLTVVISVLSSCGGGSTTGASNQGPTVEPTTNNSPQPPVVPQIPTPTPDPSQYVGVAQKGPFSVNSKVVIEKLDSAAVATGDLIESSVSNKSGKFLYEVPNDWNLQEGGGYFQIHAQGLVLDESTGLESLSAVDLIAISNNPDSSSVNVLTNWKAQRAKILISEGEDLSSALRQAEEELYDLFGITHLNRLDFTNTTYNLNVDNTLLVLLSGALMEVANREGINVQQIIDQIGDDFSAEGALDLVGNDWLKRIQATLRDNPALHLNTYARHINKSLGFTIVTGEYLPSLITFASRPSAILPTEVFAEPGETIVLDGSESHDNDEGALVNFTWFRVDQQTEFNVPLSDRFAVSPSITVPNVESVLLFALVVTDTNNLTDTTVIKVIVKVPPPVNNPPTAEGQQVITAEDVPVGITLIADDQDGDTLNFNLTTPVLLLNGILEGAPPNLVYTPDQNFNGNDSFTFTVSDDSETSSPATVDIIVSPVNDRPLAFGQTLITNEDQSITNIVLSGFDVDGDPLSFSALTNPANGVLGGASPNHSYTPNTGFNGSDSFSFVANDGVLDSIPATVLINVVAVNENPVAVDDNYTVDEDTTLVLTPLVNDTDPDGDTLVVSSINGIALTGGAQVISVINGTVNIDAGGEISFTPASNFSGESSFDYQVSDGNGGTDIATETVTITPINDAPIAVDDTYNVLEDGTVILVPLTADSDIDGGTLTVLSMNGVTLIGGPQIIPVTNGVINIDMGGSIDFNPASNFFGIVTIPYIISDGNGGTATADEIITVMSVNDAPVAEPLVIQLTGTSFEPILLFGTDVDGSVVSYTIVTAPTNGTLSVTVGTPFTSPDIFYTPNDSPPVSDSFSYKVTDNQGLDSADVQVELVGMTVIPISTYVKAINPDPVKGVESDGIAGDFFGDGVALNSDGTTMAVGASGKNIVYVYVLEGSGWVHQTSFSVSGFSGVVSLSNDGNTLVAGASNEDTVANNSGAAYVFKRAGTTWSQQALLKASNVEVNDRFGKVVSISGDGTTIAVGTTSEKSNATGINGDETDNSLNSAGATYVFKFDGSNWNQEAYVKASNTGFGDSFGSAVSLNGLGDSLIVGATSEDTAASGAGSVYHFVRAGSVWSQQGGVITTSNASNNDFFGTELAMSNDGNTFVATSTFKNTSKGAAYVFVKVSSVWVEQAILSASIADNFDEFGSSVAISADGNRILVGAPNESSSSDGVIGANPLLNDASSAGATYLFERVGLTWGTPIYIKASNSDGGNSDPFGPPPPLGEQVGSAGDAFGTSVAISDSGSTTAVGAKFEEGSDPGVNGDQTINGFLGAGAVYINPHLQ